MRRPQDPLTDELTWADRAISAVRRGQARWAIRVRKAALPSLFSSGIPPIEFRELPTVFAANCKEDAMPVQREGQERWSEGASGPRERTAGRAGKSPGPATTAQVGTEPRPSSPATVLQLQRLAGNAATARLVAQSQSATVQRMTPEELEKIKKLQERIRARALGDRAREQVRVRTESPGIIGVRVRNNDPNVLGDVSGSPLAAIRGPLMGDTEYNHLRVLGGTKQGAVRGPGEGQAGVQVGDLAKELPLPFQTGAAVINGGYFAHDKSMRSEEHWEPEQTNPESYRDFDTAGLKHEALSEVGEAGVGRPVGPTGHRTDSLPIPSEYAEHYGQVTVGGRAGLSSAPMLTVQGEPQHLPDDDRFKYRLDTPPEFVADDGPVRLNPRNKQVGALTHAGDRNTRAAISLMGRDVIMHTVTDPTMKPGMGVTMAQWQTMTMAGAGKGINPAPDLNTLNLDGGGSVYMGITGPDGVRVVAKGQRPEEKQERPVGNIIASRPSLEADPQIW